MKKNLLIILLLSLTICLACNLQKSTQSYKKQVSVFINKQNILSKDKDILLTHIKRLRSSIAFIDEKMNNDDLNNITIKLVKNRNNEEWNRDIHIGNLDGTDVYSLWSDLKSKIPDHYVFSINYPSIWKVGTSVFDDEKGNKVAEYSPGIIALQQNQPCFVESPYYKEDIISQNQIIIGKYQGELQISRVGYEGGSPNWNGTWYPNTYCIRVSNTLAFKMTFYEYSEKPLNSKLYERIISSVEVLNIE